MQLQKLEVCSVDISKDLNNANVTGGKHWVTGIVGLSAESKLLVNGTPTPLALTRLSDRKLQSDNQLPPSTAKLVPPLSVHIYCRSGERTIEKLFDNIIRYSMKFAN